jgi:hypothetical protein
LTAGQLFSGCARFASCGDYHTVMVAAQLQPADGDGQSADDAAAAAAAEAPPVVPSVLTFGRGNNGQLGHGDWEDQLLPRVVGALAEMRVDAVAAGGGLRSSHTLVASDSGRLFGFGSCAAGQLGIPLEPSSTLLCWRQQSPDAVRLAASPPSGGSGAAGVGGAGAAATLDAVALPVELGWWELPAGAQVTRPDSVGAAVAASVRSAALFGQVEPCRWRWRRQRRRRPDSSGEGGGCGGLPVQAAVRRGTPAGAAA